MFSTGEKKGDFVLSPLLRNKFVISFALLLCWMLILLFKSINPFDALVEIIRLLVLFAFFLLLFYHLQRFPNSEKLLVSGASLASLFVMAAGVYQMHTMIESYFTTGTPLLINYRVGSTLGNKNSLAEFLVLSIPFSAYGFVSSARRVKWFHGFVLFLNVLFLLLLKSLTILVAMGAGGLLFIILFLNVQKGISQTKLVLGTAVLTICLFLGGITLQHFVKSDSIVQKFRHFEYYVASENIFQKNNKENNNSIFERLLLYRNTLIMTGESPVTGVGVSNWKIFFYKYGIGGTDYISSGLVHYEHPHDDFLLVVSETGIIGLILFCALFFFVLRDGWRRLHSAYNKNHQLKILLMICGVVAFIVLSLFGYPWAKVVVVVLLMLMIAFIYSNTDEAGIENTKLQYSSLEKIFFPALMLISCFALFVGWQRFKGETTMHKVHLIKNKHDWARMTRELDTIQYTFFELDAVGTPVAWYRGFASFYDSNFAAAKDYFIKAELQHPYHLQVLHDLGSIYEIEGNHEKALSYYDKALSISPFHVQTLLNKSAVYFNLRQADSAYAYIDKMYGIRITGRDKEKYDKSLGLILYAKAYLAIRNLELSRQGPLLSKISDTGFLVKLYQSSKADSVLFVQKISTL